MEEIQRPAPWDGQQNSTPAANDEPLLDAVRNGDNQAFGELYARHCGAVFAVARLHSNSYAEAEDITSEAFTRVLALLKSGGGPRQFLRAYLVTAVSRLAADRANDLNRTQPQEPQEQGKLDRIQLFDDTVVRQVDAAVVARAFASLPERWQEVLWYLEIEGYRPRQVASVVGIQPNAVSALGKRARDGLRTAYMQQHVSAQALEECGEYSTQLGAFVRGSLTPSKMKLMQDHLDSCERCTAEYLQLQDLGVGLRGWILPILAGLPLWGDASERLLAALGTAGAGGAAGISGLVSGTTTPLGAGAEGASVPAAPAAAAPAASAPAAAAPAAATSAAATSAASVTGATTAATTITTSAAGGILAGSATKVIIAAAGVAVAGAGTVGIVSAIQQDSSEMENTRQAQPATEDPAGSDVSGGSDGEGSSAGDSTGRDADSKGDSSDTDSGSRSGSSGESGSDSSGDAGESGGDRSGLAGAPLGGLVPSFGGTGAGGGPSGDVLAGTGALLPPAPDSSSPGDNPSGLGVPTSPGDSSTPQLDIPLTPTLPGPVLPIDPQISEDTGPRDGPGTEPVVDGEEGGAPEVPGPIESSEPPVTPGPDDSESGEPATDNPDAEEPDVADPGADGLGADDPGGPNGNNGNDDPGGTGNTDPEGTGNTDPGGTGNTNPGGTGTTNPEETGNTNPETPPGNPGGGTPVTPGAPSSPENPPLAGPGTQPTAPGVNPTGPLPTTPPVQPTPPVVPPGEGIDDRGEDLTDPSEPGTGWWGTVPGGWTLIDWIVFLLTGVRP